MQGLWTEAEDPPPLPPGRGPHWRVWSSPSSLLGVCCPPGPRLADVCCGAAAGPRRLSGGRGDGLSRQLRSEPGLGVRPLLALHAREEGRAPARLSLDSRSAWARGWGPVTADMPGPLPAGPAGSAQGAAQPERAPSLAHHEMGTHVTLVPGTRRTQKRPVRTGPVASQGSQQGS